VLSHGLLGFLILRHSWNHFIGSLFNHFQILYHSLSKLSSGEPSSLLFAILSLATKLRRSVHLVFNCCLFPGLKHMLGLVFFQWLSLFFATYSLNMLSIQIALFLSITIWKHTFSDLLIHPNFYCIRWFVDDFCIIPWLWDCLTRVLRAPLSSNHLMILGL